MDFFDERMSLPIQGVSINWDSTEVDSYLREIDAIKGLELSSPLKQGEYMLDINIQTKSLDTQEAMNGASVQTKLKVN